jgi:hypothetical protein
MEFTAYLESTDDHKASDVIKAFHACLESGEKKLSDDGNTLYAAIIYDIRRNAPTIERD